MEFRLKQTDYIHVVCLMLAEAACTCGYMLSFNLEGNTNPFVLVSMCILAYRVSKAHLNPSVSLGVYVQ